MDLIRFLEVVGDIGLPLASGAIVLFLFILYENNREKRIKDLETANENELKKLAEEKERYQKKYEKKVDEILVMQKDYFERIISINCDHEHGITEDKLQEEIENQIEVHLKELRDFSSCSRASVIRYHNGMRDLVGNPFLKVSCTNEQVSIGVQPFKTQFQNQFRSLLSYINNEIKLNGFCYIENINYLKDINHFTIYEFFNSKNVKSIFCSAIYDKGKNIIGFVSLEYLFFSKATAEIKYYLTKKTEEISTLLNLKEMNSVCKIKKE